MFQGISMRKSNFSKSVTKIKTVWNLIEEFFIVEIVF